MIKYENFKKNKNSKLALSFGVGRSGQTWFTKIFNSHSNWIGTTERFEDFEAFYRYINYYNLPVDKNGFFKLLKLASNRDFAKFDNSFIASPYFCFGAEELTKVLNQIMFFFTLEIPLSLLNLYLEKLVF